MYHCRWMLDDLLVERGPLKGETISQLSFVNI